MNKAHSIVAFLMVPLAIAWWTATDCSAATVWTAASSGYWTNSANWTPAAVPGSGDDVEFNGGAFNATVDGDVNIKSLTVSNSYLGQIIFAQGAVASLSITNDFLLGTGATVVANYTSTNGLGTGRTITVGGNATINGLIDADGKGFASNETVSAYRGPGATTVSWSSAHGGIPGDGFGSNYGSLVGPIELGSGSYQNYGGGAVRLAVAGTATVNGTIRAKPTITGVHGASGGSVWLSCATFAGTGTLTADGGGSVSWGQGGGGGRVAITYNTKTFLGVVSVAGGVNTMSTGQPGTLWEPGRFTNAAASVTLNGDKYQYYFPGTASNYTWGLTLSNGATVYFHDFTNGILVLTNLIVKGSSTLRLDVDNAGRTQRQGLNSVAVSGGVLQVTSSSLAAFSEGNVGPPTVTVDVSGTSTLYLASTSHVLSTFSISTGSVVYAGPGDTNAINADSGGTAGNRHGSGLIIYCASASILGRLDASATGFRATEGPGKPANAWDGGCYGGTGGGQFGLPSGVCYGLLTRPSALGSGGKYDVSLYHYGGGAIRLDVTNDLTVNGAVRADGGTDGTYTGDAGGSIWLIANALSGTGLVSAVGGHGNLSGSHGAGGGGRIAIEYVSSTFSGMTTVSNGPALSSATPARTGTVFLCQSPILGAISDGTQGRYLLSQYSVNNHTNGVKITRSVAQWRPKWFEWTDQSVDLVSGAQLNNIATYTVTGLTANARFDVTDNGSFLFQTNSGAGGGFTFNITLNASHTVSVKGVALGTIFVIH